MFGLIPVCSWQFMEVIINRSWARIIASGAFPENWKPRTGNSKAIKTPPAKRQCRPVFVSWWTPPGPQNESGNLRLEVSRLTKRPANCLKQKWQGSQTEPHRGSETPKNANLKGLQFDKYGNGRNIYIYENT
jgi:hypothetical protein